MLLKDKLNIIKNSIFTYVPTKEELTVFHNETGSLTTLDEFDTQLDSLLEEEEASLIDQPINITKELIRLIIVLDISTSMRGTENDIYLGIKDLIKHHKKDNILFNFVVFNDERCTLFDDVYIGNVEVPEIGMSGGTNLNGSLYNTINDKCDTGINLLVTISDGEDNVEEVSAATVKKAMADLKNIHNHFYFLGEPNERQTPKKVYKEAQKLGFADENISVFTRLGNGNKLNFVVISKMLDDLIEYGKVSDEWSKPIKEHYLALTDRRCPNGMVGK